MNVIFPAGFKESNIQEEAASLQGVSLTHSYGQGDVQTTALSNVSIDLFRNRLALLMGPSGSGKSTLLAVLSGLMKPSAGQVLAQDQDGKLIDLWRLSEKEREQFRLRNCGFIFQGYNLFPALTARQQLEIVLRWGNGTSSREAKIGTVLIGNNKS